MELDPVQKVLEFEKNVLELETHDLKMGRTGPELTPKEPPILFEKSKPRDPRFS
jgi:hypothetical protein